MPLFRLKLILEQMPTSDIEQRVQLYVYPGGRTFYSRDASNGAFKADAERLIAG